MQSTHESPAALGIAVVAIAPWSICCNELNATSHACTLSEIQQLMRFVCTADGSPGACSARHCRSGHVRGAGHSHGPPRTGAPAAVWGAACQVCIYVPVISIIPVSKPTISIIYLSVRWLRIQRDGFFACLRGIQRCWPAHALVPAHGQARTRLSGADHARNLCSGKAAEQHHGFLVGSTQKPAFNMHFISWDWAPSKLLRSPNHVLDKSRKFDSILILS